MKSKIIKSAVVALVFGIIATVFQALTTASYMVTFSPNGESHVQTGLEAINTIINQHGLIVYLSSLLPWYIMLVSTLFIGCLITVIWVTKKA